MTRIAIIGAGNVGSALAGATVRAGHDVVVGVRDPRGVRHAAVRQAGAELADPATAARGAELVVLAVPWSAARDAVRSLGHIGSRVLIDATNPLLPRLAGLASTGGRSGAEQVAGWAAGGRVVKAFNAVGAEVMGDAAFDGGRPVLPVAGDDADAKAAVLALGEDLGFEGVDAGPLAAARDLEHLAFVWIRLAVLQGQGRGIAFGLLRR